MESSIVEEKLTDGSVAYNVVIVDGAQKTVIAAISKAGAEVIQEALEAYGSYATIEPHK